MKKIKSKKTPITLYLGLNQNKTKSHLNITKSMDFLDEKIESTASKSIENYLPYLIKRKTRKIKDFALQEVYFLDESDYEFLKSLEDHPILKHIPIKKILNHLEIKLLFYKYDLNFECDFDNNHKLFIKFYQKIYPKYEDSSYLSFSPTIRIGLGQSLSLKDLSFEKKYIDKLVINLKEKSLEEIYFCFANKSTSLISRLFI